MSRCVPNVYLQAFIHPGLAYFFWSTHKVTDLSLLFSPYQSCNGTFTSTINHEMTYKSRGVSFAFYDLAGCGLVHVCGEYFTPSTLFFNDEWCNCVCIYVSQEVLQHLFLVYSTNWRHHRKPRNSKIFHY